MKEQVVNIETLVQDDHNFNKGTEAGRELMERSFKQLGAGRSILIDKDGHIIAGNKSQLAAMAAGIKKVRIIETHGDELVAVKRTDLSLDSKEGRELALADNLTTQINLQWDEAELQSVAAQEGIDLPDWGLDPKDLGIEEPTDTKEAHEDDFDEEKDKVDTVCKKGDIWQLGDHRLMCGSSTEPDNIAKLMDGAKADITFSSPPYNMQAGGISRAFKSEKVHDSYGIVDGTYQEFSDSLSDEDYAKLLNDALDNCLTHSGEVLFNIGILKGSKVGILDMCFKHSKQFADLLVWNKNHCMPLSLPTQLHMLNHICEPIFCFNQTGDRTFKHSQWKLGTMHNRIDTKNAVGNEYAKIHHATFPVELPFFILQNFCKDSVLEPFGGTGTTMIAAEQLGRKCYMMELDPHYCDVIIARWEKLTGKKAIKL